MKKIFNHIPFGFKITTTALYVLVVAALSLLPAGDLPKVPLFPGADKLIHTGMYFILSFLILWTFHAKNIARWKLYSFVVGWGLLMECLQILVNAGRSFSFYDIVANVTGAIMGIALYKFLNTQFSLEHA
jgi:VanZ family protein